MKRFLFFLFFPIAFCAYMGLSWEWYVSLSFLFVPLCLTLDDITKNKK